MSPKYVLCVVCLSLLTACGPPAEPESMEGEEKAGQVVVAFMQSLEAGSYDQAKALLYKNTDYILRDLEYCRETFFPIPSTNLAVLGIGHELYGRDWHITVDLKVSYADQMKMLKFVLVPEQVPLLRGVSPLKQ